MGTPAVSGRRLRRPAAGGLKLASKLVLATAAAAALAGLVGLAAALVAPSTLTNLLPRTHREPLAIAIAVLAAGILLTGIGLASLAVGASVLARVYRTFERLERRMHDFGVAEVSRAHAEAARQHAEESRAAAHAAREAAVRERARAASAREATELEHARAEHVRMRVEREGRSRERDADSS